jgi:hypothetical protein
MRNLIQFGSIFRAAGCSLNFESSSNQLSVIGFPSDKRELIEGALKEIELFEDTATFEDGIVAIPLSDSIDNVSSPLSEIFRLQVLETSGIMHSGLWVSQVLQKIKTTRSWHGSPEPNRCVYFGEVCTNRGMMRDPNKRGRPSYRKPEEFHIRKSASISKENLVTPMLEALTVSIDSLLLTSNPQTIRIDKLDELGETELEALMDRIRKELGTRST